jgi:solute carrier family 25 phosphate transporter 23/24/25/41
MTDTKHRTVVTWRNIANLTSTSHDVVSPSHRFNDAVFTFTDANTIRRTKFATISTSQTKPNNEFTPTPAQLLNHPLAVVALVPKDAALFLAGAVAGAAAKTVTAPLDRIKLLMQVRFRFPLDSVVLFAVLRNLVVILMFMKRHCVFADSWSANWTRKCEEDNWFY